MRTALIRSALPPGLSAAEQRQARLEYYRYVADGGGPKIVVIQDVDSRIGFGCFWGEVQTAIHKALGCRGLVTDGGVRDLDAVAPEFQVLCGKVTPSHAWVHAIAFGGTVDVFGMVVRSDDLIHADRHGAVVIPHEVARECRRRPCAPGARSRSSRWRAAPTSRWTPSSAPWPRPRRFTREQVSPGLGPPVSPRRPLQGGRRTSCCVTEKRRV